MSDLVGKIVSMKVRSMFGFKGDGQVIENYGDLVRIKTDSGIIDLCRHEVSVKRNQKPLIFAREELPYGKYICENGREVYFNRGYFPIWEIHNGIVKKSDKYEWIKFIKQEWFYENGNSPWENKKTKIKCEKILLDLIKQYRGDA